MESLNAGNWAKELIKQILILSRHSDKEIKPLQFDMVVKDALKLLQSLLPSTIEIRSDIKSETVIGDSIQIHHIIMNLCTNAYHSMFKKGGILEVELLI